jgi:hypothetical protein
MSLKGGTIAAYLKLGAICAEAKRKMEGKKRKVSGEGKKLQR